MFFRHLRHFLSSFTPFTLVIYAIYAIYSRVTSGASSWQRHNTFKLLGCKPQTAQRDVFSFYARALLKRTGEIGERQRVGVRARARVYISPIRARQQFFFVYYLRCTCLSTQFPSHHALCLLVFRSLCLIFPVSRIFTTFPSQMQI